MGSEISILALTAASIAVVHTVVGPDHYLPFVALGRARRWSLKRTLSVTAICGLGHVLSSVLLGTVGIAMGLAVSRMVFFENLRGNIAAWLLIGFGLAYTVWGLRRAARGRTHAHAHAHADGSTHSHFHDHHEGHVHPHAETAKARSSQLTPWALFVIFFLGPCEPLIPLLMYPAAQTHGVGLILVVTVFSTVTVGTMVVMVALVSRGIRLVPMARLERHAHTLAGTAVLGSGLVIRFLG